MNFIKSSINSLEKLNSNANANTGYKEKYSKFGAEKFNEKKLNTENIKWLKNVNNSCRYDSFITFFAYIITPYIESLENNTVL